MYNSINKLVTIKILDIKRREVFFIFQPFLKLYPIQQKRNVFAVWLSFPEVTNFDKSLVDRVEASAEAVHGPLLELAFLNSFELNGPIFVFVVNYSAVTVQRCD